MDDSRTSKIEGWTQLQLLADFVDTSGVGLHWVAADGTILWANAADYEPLGYARDEFVGSHIAEFHADADVIDDILRRLTAGERLRDREARLRCKDGSIRSVLINSSALFDDAGQFVHTRCFTLDITDRRRIEDAREQFVNILGHDLRNPLGAIAAAAQYMQAAGDLPDKHRRAVDRIARSADRMSRLIADLLDFARVRMGPGIPIQRGAGADMAAIVTHAVDELRTTNPGREIGLEIEGDATGEWDADRVAQVVSNLVGNAVEHGSDPIRVAVHGGAEMVVLTVTNSGPPIPPGALRAIFEPFTRRQTTAGGSSSPSSHSTAAGLGLGLFIAAEIVRAHQGSIEATSTVEDGTTFAVRWPRG